MSTGPLTAPRSTPPPTHPRNPRGMSRGERTYEHGWRDGANAILVEALRSGVPVEILRRLQAIIDAGPQREQA